MFAKICSILLVSMLINLSFTQTAFAQENDDSKRAKQEEKVQKRIEKVKEGIREIGTGEDAKVNVVLLDKSKIKGHVTQIDDDSFAVKDKKGNESVLQYVEVKKLNGNNIPAGVWVAIGAAAGLAVFGIAILYAISKN